MLLIASYTCAILSDFFSISFAEARPQKFNSRLRNKMFYGQAGGKDLLQRKWKDLSEFVTLECDGKDITAKLREQKVHAVLFLNIPSYGGGTHPWNRAHGQDQATDDGLIEVVGLTTYQLVRMILSRHHETIRDDYLSLFYSLCCKRVGTVHAWHSVGRPALLPAELFQCKWMVKLADLTHPSLGYSFWIKPQC